MGVYLPFMSAGKKNYCKETGKIILRYQLQVSSSRCTWMDTGFCAREFPKRAVAKAWIQVLQ